MTRGTIIAFAYALELAAWGTMGVWLLWQAWKNHVAHRAIRPIALGFAIVCMSQVFQVGVRLWARAYHNVTGEILVLSWPYPVASVLGAIALFVLYQIMHRTIR